MANKLTSEEMAKINAIRKNHGNHELSIEELDNVTGGASYYVEDGVCMMKDDNGYIWKVDDYVEFLKDCYCNVGYAATETMFSSLNSDIAFPKKVLLNVYDEFDAEQVRRYLKNKCI